MDERTRSQRKQRMKNFEVLLTARVDLQITIKANSAKEAEQIASKDSCDAQEVDRETEVLYGQTTEVKD